MAPSTRSSKTPAPSTRQFSRLIQSLYPRDVIFAPLNLIERWQLWQEQAVEWGECLMEATMLAGKSWEEWVQRYALSHQHPANRLCHTLGIPLIAVSLPLFVVAFFVPGWWVLPLAMFVAGWVLQFVGHIFEGKPPEFFHDWRFLLVGLRWWWAKIRGRV